MYIAAILGVGAIGLLCVVVVVVLQHRRIAREYYKLEKSHRGNNNTLDEIDTLKEN